ncbi:MAG: FHIPEP family type III secretion protein [Acidobacteriota bacterium]
MIFASSCMAPSGLDPLLNEGVSIRDLLTVVETLADYAPVVRNTDLLTEVTVLPPGKPS